jgi:hypothetical protein
MYTESQLVDKVDMAVQLADDARYHLNCLTAELSVCDLSGELHAEACRLANRVNLLARKLMDSKASIKGKLIRAALSQKA